MDAKALAPPSVHQGKPPKILCCVAVNPFSKVQANPLETKYGDIDFIFLKAQDAKHIINGVVQTNFILLDKYNYARKIFLEGDYDILWFLEDDIIVQEPEKIVEYATEDFRNGADVVAFPYRLRYDGNICLFYYDARVKRQHTITFNPELRQKLFDKREIFEIANFAFGCTFLNRKVMEALPFIDYDLRYADYLMMSYDVFFAQRAWKAGYKIICDPRVFCNHVDLKAGKTYKVEDLFDEVPLPMPDNVDETWKELIEIKREPHAIKVEFDPMGQGLDIEKVFANKTVRDAMKMKTEKKQIYKMVKGGQVPCLNCKKGMMKHMGTIDDVATFHCDSCGTDIKVHLDYSTPVVSGKEVKEDATQKQGK